MISLISTLLSPVKLEKIGTRQSMCSRRTNYTYGWDSLSDVTAHELQKRKLAWGKYKHVSETIGR